MMSTEKYEGKNPVVCNIGLSIYAKDQILSRLEDKGLFNKEFQENNKNNSASFEFKGREYPNACFAVSYKHLGELDICIDMILQDLYSRCGKDKVVHFRVLPEVLSFESELTVYVRCCFVDREEVMKK